MKKPLTLIIKDTGFQLIDVCNNSGLPACILETIIKDLYNEIHELSVKQLQEDTIKYNKYLEEQEQLNNKC